MRKEILGAVVVMLIAFSLCRGLPQEPSAAEAAHTAREQKKNRTIQENLISTKEIPGETESLRNKLEQQAAQISELQRSLQRQADLIERQQRLLEALQQKAEQAGTPTIASAALHESPPVVEAKVAEAKAVSTATPKMPQSVESGYGKVTEASRTPSACAAWNSNSAARSHPWRNGPSCWNPRKGFRSTTPSRPLAAPVQ